MATKHRPSASLPRRADLRCESNLPRRCRSTFARRRSPAPEDTSRSQRCNIGMHVDPDCSDEEEIATGAALNAAGENRRKKQPFDKNRVLLAVLGREAPGAPANAMGCAHRLPSFFPSDVQQIWVDWARRIVQNVQIRTFLGHQQPRQPRPRRLRFWRSR